MFTITLACLYTHRPMMVCVCVGWGGVLSHEVLLKPRNFQLGSEAVSVHWRELLLGSRVFWMCVSGQTGRTFLGFPLVSRPLSRCSGRAMERAEIQICLEFLEPSWPARKAQAAFLKPLYHIPDIILYIYRHSDTSFAPFHSWTHTAISFCQRFLTFVYILAGGWPCVVIILG